MKTMKKVVAMMLVAVMLMFCFAGCGAEDVSGTYTVTSLSIDDEDYLAMIQEYGSALGITEDTNILSMVLDKDGNFSFTSDVTELLDQIGSAEGTYVVDGTTITLTANGTDSEGTIKDGVLSFEEDGMSMEFTKQDE